MRRASLEQALQALGMMVTYGNASGPVPPLAPLELAKRGSLFLTRPTLFHYIARRADLDRATCELFDVIGSGAVRIEIGQSYALQDAAQAHRDLEARRTVGSTVLVLSHRSSGHTKCIAIETNKIREGNWNGSSCAQQ